MIDFLDELGNFKQKKNLHFKMKFFFLHFTTRFHYVCKPIACANAEQQGIKKGETILQDQTARGIFISDENRPESASFNNQGSMIGALLIKWEPLTTPI